MEELDPDFVYLTHQHWDHFHGPTLRRLGLHRHVLIPKTPDCRVRDDLRDMGCTRITELVHGRPFAVGPGFRVTSYQFGHFPGLRPGHRGGRRDDPERQRLQDHGPAAAAILRDHPKVDFVLRSHSSANARLCFEITDRGGLDIDDQSTYSAEFADFARAVGARYAIPFASNNCYLHPDTERFNRYLNLGINVKRHFEAHGITEPECVVCAPGDGWDDEKGFVLGDKDWYTHLDEHLARYKEAKAPVIEKAMRREARITLKEEVVRALRGGAVRRDAVPRPSPVPGQADHPGRPQRKGDAAYELDIYNRTWRRLDGWNDADNPVQIHASAQVFLMCIRQVNWNSLGISKRARFRVRDADKRIVTYFTELNDLFDCEVLPLSKSLNPRFVTVWLRRWREVVLYLQISADLARGRGFAYSNYLGLAPARHVGTAA